MKQATFITDDIVNIFLTHLLGNDITYYNTNQLAIEFGPHVMEFMNQIKNLINSSDIIECQYITENKLNISKLAYALYYIPGNCVNCATNKFSLITYTNLIGHCEKMRRLEQIINAFTKCAYDIFDDDTKLVLKN